MYTCEFKVRAHAEQRQAIDEAIRTAQFIRNKCLRLWMDVRGTGKAEMSAYCAVLATEFPFAKTLNSMARQASAERAWAAVSRSGLLQLRESSRQNLEHSNPSVPLRHCHRPR